jgi:phosphoribosylaminoimidazole (AIR) synthetase
MSRYKEEIIKPGDKASKLAHEICVGSYNNCPAIIIIPREPGNFRGGVDFNWNKEVLRLMIEDKIRQTIQNDGAGGKPQFFTLLGTRNCFFGLGWEIIAMSADDVARKGGKAVVMSNDLNVRKITAKNYPLVEALFYGYGQALKESDQVNITGEIAVMKHSITAFCENNDEEQLVLTWGGTCLGLTSDEKTIDGSKIGDNMPVIGLLERGYRCNVGTFFSELLLNLAFCPGMCKKNWFDPNFVRKHAGFISRITEPSISYAKSISRIHGWKANGTTGDALAKIAGIAHITGGGVWGKFGEILPEGIGAHLHNMPKPPSVLLEGQALSQNTAEPLDDWHAYETFHGGCGMLVVLETDEDADIFVREVGKDGIAAQEVGRTIKSVNNQIFINSKFMEYDRVLNSEDSKMVF